MGIARPELVRRPSDALGPVPRRLPRDPQLSLGLEGRFDIDAQGDCDIKWAEGDECKDQYRNQHGSPTDLFDYSRGGLFARYEWEGGEISAAAGISGAFLGRDGSLEPDPNASVSWIKQY